jgi:predicted nuclease of predicted toxin-antitoxin system
MRFKIDENLHDDVAALLAGHGYDVHTVHTEGLRGCDDMALAQQCRVEGRAILTLDLDFADIRRFPPADYAGLIVLRVGDQSRRHVLNVVTRILDLLKSEPLAGRLWIGSDADVRIRDG